MQNQELESKGKARRNGLRNTGLAVVLVGALSAAVGCSSVSYNPIGLSQSQMEILYEELEPLKGDYTLKDYTTVHRLLEIEAELGARNKHYELLDKLREESLSKIEKKRQYNLEETVNILKTIDETLVPYKKDIKKPRSSLLSVCLEDKLLDCDSMSLVYLSVGERINLPIKLVSMPNHIFMKVRYKKGKDGEINWDPAFEVTGRRTIPNEEYREIWKVKEWEEWPKVLEKKDVIAMEYSNLGSTWLNQYYLMQWKERQEDGIDPKLKYYLLDMALQNLNKSNELSKKFYDSYYNRGLVYYEMDKKDLSLQEFEQAGMLWFNDSKRLAVQGRIFLEDEEYDKAMKFLDIAIDLDPFNDKAYASRSEVWYKKGETKKALDDLKTALGIILYGEE